MKKAPAKKIPTEKIKKALNNNVIEKVNNNKIRNKTMLNKVKWFTAKIVNKIDSIFSKIGFHYVGYKVYISEMMKDIKAIKEDVNSIDNRVNDVDSIDYETLKDDCVYEVEYKIDDIQSDLNDLRRSVERREYDNNNDDVNDDIKALDKRVKLLEGLAFTGDDNADDVKIDNIINDGLIIEFAQYLTDMLDSYNLDTYYHHHKSIRRDLILALLECKNYNIKLERVKK